MRKFFYVLHRVVAVSYTHRDVYKRQVQTLCRHQEGDVLLHHLNLGKEGWDSLAHHIFSDIYPFSFFHIHFQIDKMAVEVIGNQRIFKNYLGPVSYTHLRKRKLPGDRGLQKINCTKH